MVLRSSRPLRALQIPVPALTPVQIQTLSLDRNQAKVESLQAELGGFVSGTMVVEVLSTPPPPGPLRSMVEEIQSEESDDDDSTSEEEAPIKTNPPNRDSRSVSQRFPFNLIETL